jgi:hypothetical protein
MRRQQDKGEECSGASPMRQLSTSNRKDITTMLSAIDLHVDLLMMMLIPSKR